MWLGCKMALLAWASPNSETEARGTAVVATPSSAAPSPPPPPAAPPLLPTAAQCSCSEDAVQAAQGAVQAKEEAVQAKQEAVRAKQEAVQAKQEVVQAKQEAVQAKQEAVQAKQDAEQAKQAAATLMEEYERRKLSAAALESASSSLGLGQTIGVAVGCSLAVVLLVAALGLFVLKRGRRKRPSATNEAAAGVQLKAGDLVKSESQAI